MKGYTGQELLEKMAREDAVKALDYCIDQLIKEKHKTLQEEVCVQLTYEELIGALLKALYEFKRQQLANTFIMEVK